MVEQPLEDLLARLERERLDADRLYNDALTAVNRAIQHVPALPDPPAAFDASRLGDVNSAWTILPADTLANDRGWRARLRGFIWRMVGPPLERQQQFNAALVDHLNRNAMRDRALPDTTAAVITALRRALDGLFRFESLLVQYLMTITAFVDSRDRRLGAEDLAAHLSFVEQRIAAIAREMDRLHAPRLAADVMSASPSTSEVFRTPVDSTTYLGFEDRFRGSQDDIRMRVEGYLPILSGASDVVDVGCGRGELLSALRDRGIRARGVDANHAMVELCKAQGLDVDESDAVSYLEQQGAGTLGGLVAIQVVEHFTPGYLSRFLAVAHQALRPGAPLVLETINPACWAAFFDTYIRDLTHQQPLHPETLKYLVQATGFTQVDIQFRQPVRSVDRLERVDNELSDIPSADRQAIAALVAAVNAHADKLNARMFSHFDYAVVARR